ncbi:MAG TPA: DEAD/DEAH box helicase [Prevotella sp.]|nr:DEAD/DEAH box helicase [Prevotella sp.]
MKFEELDLTDNVLDALYDMRFDECTPVQEKCIPPILEGHDVLGVAQTGTGKTAAYLLPILSRLDSGNYPKDAVNCIVMSPTRELAQQIDQAMQGFSYYLPDVSSVAVYGGNDGNRYDQEMKSMRLGADVIIATPGRLISHISMGNIDLSKVSFFVLDEADRMLDMGFSDDIMKIASKLPKNCQTIMFSATMPKDIEKLAQSLLKNPVEVKLAVSKPAEKIKQVAYICYETQKLQIIQDIFKAGDLKRVIIFSGSKMKVKQINQALLKMKINSGAMHSDLEQAERDDIMFKFKSGQIDVLVATDIVARGIDIDDIAMVINFDVPHDAEDYVHRIGRTARADRDGVGITFVNEDDMYAFHQIEKFLGQDIQKNALPEGCGEGPEYTTSRRPGKTSAKSRRRKDRDNNAHKDAKQRSGRKDKADNRKSDDRQRQKPKRTNQQPQQQEQQEQQGKQQGQPQGQQQSQPKQDKRQRGKGQKQERQHAQQQARPEGEAQRQRGRHKYADKQRGQQSQTSQAKQKGQTSQAVDGNKKAKKGVVQPNLNERGLKGFIKHPLRWIMNIGKK